jgi:hypothetical protein
MNKLSLILIAILSTVIIPVLPALATSFDDGFNAGKAAADGDATALEEGEKKGVDANHIKCPSKHDDEFCRGYRQGYSDEAQARLE